VADQTNLRPTLKAGPKKVAAKPWKESHLVDITWRLHKLGFTPRIFSKSASYLRGSDVWHDLRVARNAAGVLPILGAGNGMLPVLVRVKAANCSFQGKTSQTLLGQWRLDRSTLRCRADFAFSQTMPTEAPATGDASWPCVCERRRRDKSRSPRWHRRPAALSWPGLVRHRW